MEPHKRPGKVLLSLIVVIVFFSISSASILVLLSGAPFYACAFWRMLISTLLVSIPLIASRSSLSYLNSPQTILLTLAAGIALGAHFLLWMKSLFLVPVAVSVTIVSTYPFFNLIIDFKVFKERISKRQIIYMILGFVFLSFFVNPRFSGSKPEGFLLALGGALAASTYFSIGKSLRRTLNLSEYVTPVYLFATLTILAYSILTRANLIHYGIKSYIYFVLLAVIPMMGGHTLMNYLLRFMKSSTVTSIALTEPIGASLLAYFILNQHITPSQALLIASIILCVAGVIYEESKE